jgi:signal transduction histidine kinase
MTVPRRLVAGSVVGAATILAVDLAVYGPADVRGWLPDVLVGLVLLVAALAVAARRDARAAAPLAATALTWTVGGLAAPLVFLHRVALTHALVAGQDGRVRDRLGRFVVGAACVIALPPLATGLVRVSALSVLLVAGGLFRARRGRGVERRQRASTVVALICWSAVLVTVALVHDLVPEGDLDVPVLLGYQVAVAGLAVAAARKVLASEDGGAAVADAVVQLGQARAGALRDALAAALGDPSLDIWFRNRSGYVDAVGRQVSVERPGVGRVTEPIRLEGDVVAVLVLDEGVAREPLLRDGVAAAGALVGSNVRLQADVRARVVELEESRRRVLRSADEARARLAVALRAGPSRRLDAMAASLAGGAGADVARVQLLRDVRVRLGQARDDLERLAAGMHPRALEDAGLCDALAALGGGSIEVRVASVPTDVPPTTAATVWYLCAEAVANAAKHSGAPIVIVDVGYDGPDVTVRVTDAGAGGADLCRGTGLRGLADRLEAYGGWLSVTSEPGSGTTLLARLPLRAPG